MIFDEQKKPVDYRFLVVNASFERQTGMLNAVGKRMREFAPDHEEHWFEIYGKIALTGESIRFENRAEQLHRWYDVYAFRFGEPANFHVAILFNDITERKKTEEELKKVNKELEAITDSVTRELRTVSGHLEKIREEDRSRIAREIDDQIGQLLTGLKMDIVSVRKAKNARVDSPEIQQKFETIVQMLDEAVVSVRKIASDLRPSILDDFGLIDALEWHSNEFTKRSGISVEFSYPDKEVSLDPEINIGLYRIYQEVLTNVARHADAKNVKAAFTISPEQLFLTIADDGKGFDSSQGTSSLGILGMKERAYLIGGKVSISSVRGKGTVVEVVVPFSRDLN
jgi:signal transduction histidine kinase